MDTYFFLLAISIIPFVGVFTTQEVFACNDCRQVKVDIQLGIINGYSGTLSFVDQYYFDGTQYYTSESSANLSLGSTESSAYTVLANDTSIQSGTGIGAYSTTLSAPLLGPDRLFEFQASFTNSEDERVQSNTLLIQKDTVPPPVVDQLSVQFAKAGGNTGLIVSRDPVSDDKSGIAGYHVVFGSDSSMISTVQFTTSSGPLVVDTSLIPAGFTTVQIVAFDNVGNTSRSIPIEYSPSILIEQSGTISSVGRGESPRNPIPSQNNTPGENPTTNPEQIPNEIPPIPDDQILVFQDTDTTEQNSAPDQIPSTPNNTVLIFQDIDTTTIDSPNDEQKIGEALVVQVPALVLPQDNIFQNTYDWSWIRNIGDTTVDTPQSGIRGLGSAPYNQILMCGDGQCVEISNSGEVCSEVSGELTCTDIQPQLLHSVANSQQETYYTALIAYHKDLSKRLKYMIVLLYYSLCYDIEIHLRWIYLLNNKK